MTEQKKPTTLKVIEFKGKDKESNTDAICRVLEDYIDRLRTGKVEEPSYFLMFTDNARWALGLDTHDAYIGILEMEKMDYFLSIIEWEDYWEE